MRSKSMLFAVVMLVAAPLFAGATKIFASYETVRQALLKTNVVDVQATAKQLAAVARSEKQEAIAAKADALSQARNIAAARTVFGSLSDEVIKFRTQSPDAATVVAYCPMEKKSWVQPKGAISNPYVSASMRSCGEIRK